MARWPRSWACAEDQSEPIRQWVSEDRRSRPARWGAWATKVRRQFGITHLDVASTLLELAAALANDVDGIHIPKQPAANLSQPCQRTFQACKAFRLRFGRLRGGRPKGEPATPRS